jgi:hypothetical protein
MNAKLSEKAKAILRSPRASRALMEAITNNLERLHNGEAIPFKVPVNEDGKIVERYITVKKVTPI